MKTASEPELPFVRSGAFRGVGAFFLTELRVQLHESLAILTSMIVQGVLLIFVWVLDRSLLGVALLGAIVFSAFVLGQRVQNEAAYVRIDHKLNQLYLASPLAPESYFLGMAAGVLVAYLGPIFVLVAIAATVLHFTLFTSALLITVFAAVWFISSAIGYVFSTFFRDNRAIWPYSSLFYNLFGVLPPVFYPLALFPLGLRPVALLLPPSDAAALLQAAFGFTSLSRSDLVFGSVVLAAEAVGLFLFAVYWSRRTVRMG